MNPSSSCGDFVVTEEPVDPIVLIVGNGGSSVGSSGLLEVSMDNNEAIGGISICFRYKSSIASISQITTTDRTTGFTVSTANGIVVGFSLTGDVIQPGSGPIINVEMVGESGGNAEVCLDNIVLSDPSGLALPSTSECGSYSVQDGPVSFVRLYTNSASPTVDVYVDGGLAISGFEYRTATPVLTLPTSFTVGIAPTGGEVIADFPFELVDGGSYVVVATGLLGDTTTPFGLAATAADFNQADATVVGLNVYHGSTDAPAVDIWADDAPLLTSFSYGDFSGPVEVPAADYTLV